MEAAPSLLWFLLPLPWLGSGSMKASKEGQMAQRNPQGSTPTMKPRRPSVPSAVAEGMTMDDNLRSQTSDLAP